MTVRARGFPKCKKIEQSPTHALFESPYGTYGAARWIKLGAPPALFRGARRPFERFQGTYGTLVVKIRAPPKVGKFSFLAGDHFGHLGFRQVVILIEKRPLRDVISDLSLSGNFRRI